MSIETRKSGIRDDLSIKTLKMKSLLANISSDFSFHFINSSFEFSKEIMTDLYDKDNVFQRRFNYFKFPDYVKQMSVNFVDTLFHKEIQLQMEKEIERRRITRKASKVLTNSKMSDFFENLANSNKKRSKKKKALFLRDNFSSIDDNFKIVDDRNDSFEKEFKIDEEDCEEIQINNQFEDSFQNDLSDIIMKSRAQSKYRKKRFVDENQNDGLCSEKDCSEYKEKKKKKKRKKKKRNKSYSDSSSLARNINKAGNMSLDNSRFSKRYSKEEENDKINKHNQKDKKKKKRDKNDPRFIIDDNKSKIEKAKNQNKENENDRSNKKKKYKKKKNKKSCKQSSSEIKNRKKKFYDSNRNSFSESDSDTSESLYSNSSFSSSSSESGFTSNSNTSSSSSGSYSDTDSSYISINSSERFNTDDLIEEKRLIEDQIMKECEIHSNDNTIIRGNKLEKLKDLNFKIEKLNENIEKQMQRAMNKKILETLTKGNKHKKKEKKHKKKRKYNKSMSQNENKSNQSMKIKDQEGKKNRDSSKSVGSENQSEKAKTNKNHKNETLKDIKSKPEAEKDNRELRIIKENVSQKSSSNIEKSSDKRVVGFKNSISKAKDKKAKNKNKEGKLDLNTSLNSSLKSFINHNNNNKNNKWKKKNKNDTIPNKNMNDMNNKTYKINENKERKGILNNKKKEKINEEKTLKSIQNQKKNLINEHQDGPGKKKFDVGMKKSFSNSNKNSDMSLPKGKTLRNLKTIKSLESNLEYEEDEGKENSSSSLSISENNNNNNNNLNKNHKKNKNKFSKIKIKTKQLNDLKDDSISSRYLGKKKKKNENEEILKPNKIKKKESDTDLNDGTGISKLKLLKRQITQQKKDLMFNKGSFLQKPLSNSTMDPEMICNRKNSKNFKLQNESLVARNIKNSRIALNKYLMKIGDLNASLNNGSENSQSFTSPVAARIKNPLKIKDEIKNVFQTIKIMKEEKDLIKNSLDEEKLKIKKNNLINLVIDETKYMNSNESLAHGRNYDNNNDNKPIQLKFNMLKVSNEHVMLDKMKNKFIEEFKKVKSELEDKRNSNKKSTIISDRKISDLTSHHNEDKNKSNNKNSNSSLTKKSSVAYRQMDIIPEISKFHENIKVEKEIELKGINPLSLNVLKSNLENVNSINCNLNNYSSQSNSNNNKNLNSFRNKNNSRDGLVSEINLKFKNESQEEIEELENNKIIVTENDVNSILNKNNDKGSKYNSKNNLLPALKLNNSKDTQKKLIEGKSPKNATCTIKNVNSETNFSPKDKIESLKNSQKMLVEKLNLESKKGKTELNINKNDNGYLNINNSIKENASTIHKKISQAISNEEQKQKAQEMKEKMKIIDENKKQNFQNLIKINIQKNHNRIKFDFDSSGDDSQNMKSENVKQIESNNNVVNNNIIRGNIINFKRGIIKNVYKQESLKLKQKEDYSQKFLSPIASNVDWMKKPIIMNSPGYIKNSNNFMPNKTNEDNFFTVDPSSNNNTKKNLFLHIQSENQIKLMSNNNIKNDSNIVNNQNYNENKLINGIKLESNKQLLNVNNDNKNRVFHLNSFNNQNILIPSFKDTNKNKDSKNLNTNGFSSFRNQKNRGSSFLGNNTNCIDNNKNKLSEVKLPNIK